MKNIRCFILAILLSFGALLNGYALECGADRLDQLLPLIEGRRVGLIVNQTSVVGEEMTHLLDTLIARGVDVVAAYAPEHGFRGDADAGEKVVDGRDSRTGVAIKSLYGASRRPSEEQLQGVDILVFDIQDVGARFYTYISTLYYVMQSCGEFDIPIVVLDRPNPNDYVDGPIIREEHKSFVGALSIPLLHGLTVGELALMIDGERWASQEPLDLEVVEMRGWSHGEPYSLPIKPSPNLPNDQSIALYPSLCLFEATEVSVGRGTYDPFQIIGYPDPKFGEYTFTPQSLPGFEKNPLQRDKLCYGVDLREVSPPKGFSLGYFIDFMERSGEGAAFITREKFFDMLLGDSALREMITSGASEAEIRKVWQSDLKSYNKMRQKYLLYRDY